MTSQGASKEEAKIEFLRIREPKPQPKLFDIHRKEENQNYSSNYYSKLRSSVSSYASSHKNSPCEKEESYEKDSNEEAELRGRSYENVSFSKYLKTSKGS